MKIPVLTVVTLTAIAFGLAAPAPAQEQRPRRAGFGAQLGGAPAGLLEMPLAVQAKLMLSDEQKTQIAAIRTKSQEEARSALQGAAGGGDRRAAFQALADGRRKAEAAAEALLTADQKKQFEALKTQAQAYQGLGRESVALLAVDGLTADQQSQLKKLATDTQAKRQELLRGLQGAGGAGGGRDALRQMQQQQAETTAAVRKVLTTDQAKQFDAAVASMPGPGAGGLGGRPRRPGNNPP